MAWIEERITKSGKKYYVYERIGGKRLSHPAGYSYQNARIIKRDIEDRVLKGQYNVSVDQGKTIDEVADEYIKYLEKLNKSKRTVHITKYALKKIGAFFGHKKISEIMPADIERFKDKVLERHRVNGTRIIVTHVKAFFGYAITRGYIVKNPGKGSLKDIPPQKVARFLNLEEVEKLCYACRFNPELLDIVLVALHSGMRLSEILNIQAEHIKEGHILISLDKAFNTKTKEPRVVPINKAIAQIFARVKSGKIFPGWSIDRLERAFRRAVQRSGLGRIRFHDLRHTFASTYLQSGGTTTAELMSLLGHKTLAALQIYTHFQKKYLEEKINKVKYQIDMSKISAQPDRSDII